MLFCLVAPGDQETAIYARTNGYVRQWLVDIGAKVEAGQLLAAIETPEVDQELSQARAAAGRRLLMHNWRGRRWRVGRELVNKRVVSAQEFDEKKSGLDARRARSRRGPGQRCKGWNNYKASKKSLRLSLVS